MRAGAGAAAGGGGLSRPVFPPPRLTARGSPAGPGRLSCPVTLTFSGRRCLPVTLGVPLRFPPVPPSPAFPGGRGSALRRGVPQAALLRRSAPQHGGEGRAGVPSGSQRVGLRRYLACPGSVQLWAALKGVKEPVVPLPLEEPHCCCMPWSGVRGCAGIRPADSRVSASVLGK